MSSTGRLLLERLKSDFKFTINSVMRLQYGSDEDLLSTKYVFSCDEMEQLVKVRRKYSESIFFYPFSICSVLDRICSCQTLRSQYFTKREQNRREKEMEKLTRYLSCNNTRGKASATSWATSLMMQCFLRSSP